MWWVGNVGYWVIYDRPVSLPLIRVHSIRDVGLVTGPFLSRYSVVVRRVSCHSLLYEVTKGLLLYLPHGVVSE